mgnify:CR=1 FL=1
MRWTPGNRGNIQDLRGASGRGGVALPLGVGGVLMLGFIGSLAQSAAAQAAYTVVYTQLFSLISLWTPAFDRDPARDR